MAEGRPNLHVQQEQLCQHLAIDVVYGTSYPTTAAVSVTHIGFVGAVVTVLVAFPAGLPRPHGAEQDRHCLLQGSQAGEQAERGLDQGGAYP